MTTDNINIFIAACEKTAHAYFWTANSSASSRRSAEHRLSEELDVTYHIEYRGIQFEFHITGDLDIQMSCKHVYRHVTTRINGVSTNITTLRSILRLAEGSKKLTPAFIRKYAARPNMALVDDGMMVTLQKMGIAPKVDNLLL